MLYTDKLVKNVYIMNNYPLLILISQIILSRLFLLIEHVQTITPPPSLMQLTELAGAPLSFFKTLF